MKREKRALYRSFGPVKLFLSDVRSVVDALQEIADTARTTIVAAGYELSSIDELSQLGQRELRSLKITCVVDKPLSILVVEIREMHASLHCTEDTPAHRGVFARVEDILSSRRRRFQWIEPITYFLTGGGAVSAILLIQGQISKIPLFTYVGYGIAALMVTSFVAYLATVPTRKSIILLCEAHDRPSFFVRNKDRLIVGVIMSVLGVVATLVVQALTNK